MHSVSVSMLLTVQVQAIHDALKLHVALTPGARARISYMQPLTQEPYYTTLVTFGANSWIACSLIGHVTRYLFSHAVSRA